MYCINFPHNYFLTVFIYLLRAPVLEKSEVHILSLPLNARSENICLKFFQPLLLPDAISPFSFVNPKVIEVAKPTVLQTSSQDSTPLVTTMQPTTYKKAKFSKPWEKHVFTHAVLKMTTSENTGTSTMMSTSTTEAERNSTTNVYETTPSGFDNLIHEDQDNFSLVVNDEAQSDQGIINEVDIKVIAIKCVVLYNIYVNFLNMESFFVACLNCFCYLWSSVTSSNLWSPVSQMCLCITVHHLFLSLIS